MRKQTLTLEHIDPRNHHLVSGLKNDFNEIVADRSYNCRKTNRFVPYRVCEYSAPVTFGDIGEFLIGDHWVVCEFGGEIWWNESNKIGNGCVHSNRSSGHETNKRNGTGFYSFENQSKAGVIGAETNRINGTGAWSPKCREKAANTQKWKCLVTGFISRPGPLSRYQKKRGIDTSLRERIS